LWWRITDDLRCHAWFFMEGKHMYRLGVLLGLFLSLAAQAGNFYLDIDSNQDTYHAGDAALITVRMKRRPLDEQYEFYVSAALGSDAVPVTTITPDHSYFKTAPLAEGVHQVDLSLFIQDKGLAFELNQSVKYYSDDILATNIKLAAETDPTIIADLQLRLAQDQNRLNAINLELNSIRRPVAQSASIVLTVLP
jgi:hypothetical protein